MNVVDQIKSVVEKVTSDKTLMEKFEKDPIKTVEGIIGVDLPDDVINQVVDGVKAKVTKDKITDGIDKLKKLF